MKRTASADVTLKQVLKLKIDPVPRAKIDSIDITPAPYQTTVLLPDPTFKKFQKLDFVEQCIVLRNQKFPFRLIKKIWEDKQETKNVILTRRDLLTMLQELPHDFVMQKKNELTEFQREQLRKKNPLYKILLEKLPEKLPRQEKFPGKNNSSQRR